MVRRIAPRMSRRTIGSRPDDGSSRTSNSGRYASAVVAPKRRVKSDTSMTASLTVESHCTTRPVIHAPGQLPARLLAVAADDTYHRYLAWRANLETDEEGEDLLDGAKPGRSAAE